MAIALQQIDATDVVRKALADAKDRAGAVALLVARVKADPDIRLAVYDKFQPSTVEEVCAAAIRFVAPAERQIVRVLGRSDEEESDRHLMSRVSRIKESLGRWTLPDGIKLQRATREDVIRAAEFVEKQARALMAVGRQYRAIAERMSPGQVVGDAYDDEELAHFFDQG